MSPCGRYVIVFNGEIYNYLELRKELASQGIGCTSDSDTEVLLACYSTWGPGCLERLNGMFAFAIWDAGSDAEPASLFFARDRVGKKPLYLRRQGHTLSFASELKAFRPYGPLDLRALNHYLALGYVPGELCIAAGIQKLPPAYAGRFVPATAGLALWQYWQLPRYRSLPADRADLIGLTQATLEDAVRVRLRSDVPVGVLLSGGLDSSLVAHLAAGASRYPLSTFTITLPGMPQDESVQAARVARILGTRHHELALERPTLDALESIGRLVDEPIGDSSIIPTFLVSGFAARHVKVVLGGDGGDEIFGGYDHYWTAMRDCMLLGWAGRPLLRAAAELAGHLPAGVRGRARLYGLRGGVGRPRVWGSPYFDAALRQRILKPEALDSLGAALLEPEHLLETAGSGEPDPVLRMTRTDFLTQLPDGYLTKLDRASMANGLEIRAPMLDYRMVELAFALIPSRLKVCSGRTRIIEREVARRLLPPELRFERKQGFSIPMDHWLRVSGCQEVRDLQCWLPAPIAGAEIDGLIRGQLRGRTNGARLFSLMMLALACRNAGLTA